MNRAEIRSSLVLCLSFAVGGGSCTSSQRTASNDGAAADSSSLDGSGESDASGSGLGDAGEATGEASSGDASPSEASSKDVSQGDASSEAGDDDGADASSSPAGSCDSGDCADWAQWPMPNSPDDVDAGAPNPTSYSDQSDGTVLDNVTGLVWQQVVPTALYAWADATTYCTGLSLAGKTGWRLPTYVELVSIVDYSRAGPAIDSASFPSTPANDFWSSSPVGALPGRARFVSFDDGSTESYSGYDVTLAYNVRCCIAPPPAGGDRYSIVGGMVYDNRTKLAWQRVSPSTSGTWDAAKSYCAGLSLDGATWRLPTVKELSTIVDVAQTGTSVDAVAFPDAPPDYFWTSTPLSNDANNSWLVDFSGGAAYAFGAVSVEYDMRCVH